MKITKKIFLILRISVGVISISFIGLLFYDSYQESKFYNIEIPKNLKFEKPIEFLIDSQIDSLKKIKINDDKLVVIGNGYGGYNFYMWHKPIEKGEIYIKAFELTQNVRLSEWKLSHRTKNTITKLSNKYQLYQGSTVIDEGTFENFYPTRFELWFKSRKSGIEKKLTEKNYIIDGWDR
jgi:hypothetical protein